MLHNNANKIALIIMTPMTLFITVSADFFLLILMKFRESSFLKGKGVFQEDEGDGG
jgi:hypothetical protein